MLFPSFERWNNRNDRYITCTVVYRSSAVRSLSVQMFRLLPAFHFRSLVFDSFSVRDEQEERTRRKEFLVIVKLFKMPEWRNIHRYFHAQESSWQNGGHVVSIYMYIYVAVTIVDTARLKSLEKPVLVKNFLSLEYFPKERGEMKLTTGKDPLPERRGVISMCVQLGASQWSLAWRLV